MHVASFVAGVDSGDTIKLEEIVYAQTTAHKSSGTYTMCQVSVFVQLQSLMSPDCSNGLQ